jgi:hypothetical protein
MGIMESENEESDRKKETDSEDFSDQSCPVSARDHMNVLSVFAAEEHQDEARSKFTLRKKKSTVIS